MPCLSRRFPQTATGKKEGGIPLFSPRPVGIKRFGTGRRILKIPSESRFFRPEGFWVFIHFIY